MEQKEFLNVEDSGRKMQWGKDLIGWPLLTLKVEGGRDVDSL